jgi:hypothetical protein
MAELNLDTFLDDLEAYMQAAGFRFAAAIVRESTAMYLGEDLHFFLAPDSLDVLGTPHNLAALNSCARNVAGDHVSVFVNDTKITT